ncbi:FG-GAP repeat protein [Microbispora sp. NPDC049125]|uniref:FG-GAP repeat protein n=1 Tax=Microbispora sp. NPDC049125 TaxID=3154929 RepID=UPI003467B594
MARAAGVLLVAAALLLTCGAAVTPTTTPEAVTGECAAAGAADFDGDGVGDAVAGDPFAPSPDGTDAGTGRLFLLRGRPGAPLDPAVTEFDPAAPGWIARTGHVDGDRCLDLVVATPFAYGGAGSAQARGAGVAYVYWGGRDFGRSPARLELRAPVARTGAHFGWSLAVADGMVAVGAPHEDADEVTDSGAVYVYRFTGRVPGPPQRITQNTPRVPGSGEVGDMFGWSLALGRIGGAADQTDLVVGAPFEDQDNGQADTGGVTVVYDVSSRPWSYEGAGWNMPAVTADVPSHAGDHFGYSLAYGEGYLAAGAPTADSGGVRDSGAVLLFQRTGSGPRFVRLLRDGPGASGNAAGERDRFGFSLAFAGPSLLVGAPGESRPGAPESGAVHVVPLAGPPGRRMLAEERPAPYDHFGWSVSGTADGRILAGAPDRGRLGAVTVALTSTGPLPPTGTLTPTGAPTPPAGSVSSGASRELLPTAAGPAGRDALDFGAGVAG